MPATHLTARQRERRDAYGPVYGPRLMAARRNAGKSRDWLARQLKCSYELVCRYEQGRKYPLPARLAKIQRLLGVVPPVES